MPPTPQAHGAPKNRIDYIDGLRGVAILAVILFHALARWPELYVYGDRFVGNPVVDTKTAGVNLFFIISGFVILMTLRTCRNFTDFMLRRWYRLFPAMLVCSTFILATAALFPERPGGDIHIWDLAPGLTFIGDGPDAQPLWDALYNLTGVHISSIEGAFWSLYVEVRFYILFGGAYFLFGEYAGIGLIFALFVLSRLSTDRLLTLHFGPSDSGGRMLALLHQFLSMSGIAWLTDNLMAKTYGFFAAGALFFLFHVTRKRVFFWLAAAAGLLAALSISDGRGANLCVTLLFILAMSSNRARHILSNRILVFIGFVSYPLYLLHENMMVAMIVKIGHAFPHMPALLIPVLPVGVAIALAWVIARYIDPFIRSVLRTRTKAGREQPSLAVSR